MARINISEKIKIFKIILDELIYGGHLLSLGASAIVLMVTILIERKVSVPLLIIAYLITQIVYVLDHRKGLNTSDEKTNPERAQHLKKIKSFFPITISLYIISLLTMVILFSSLNIIIYIVALGLLGYIYPKKLTKSIVGFKNYFVAFLWAVSSVLMPYIFFSIKIDALFYFVFVFVFVRWLINTTFFDLKDIKSDRREGLKTFPVVYGKTNTIILLAFYNIVSGIILFCAIKCNIIGHAAYCLLLLIIYSFYYLFLAVQADKTKIRKISYIMVDGEYILWPVLIFVGGLIIR